MTLANLNAPTLLTGLAAGDTYTGMRVFGLSPDGNRIAFRTAESLAAADTDLKQDVYVWEPTGRVLMTPGTTHDILTATVADDISRVAFQTDAKLVAADTNVYNDAYVMDFDLIPPTPLVVGPAPFTASTSADLKYSTTEGAAARAECRVDGGTWASCASVAHLDGLADGGHIAEMRAWDAVGNGPGTASRTWTVDTVPPTAGAPSVVVVPGSTMGTNTVAVRVAWSGADSRSGIVSSQLEQRIDGGAWMTVAGAVHGFSATRGLAPGHAYAFRVTTRDGAGHQSLPATGATVKVIVAPETSTAIAYSGPWGTLNATSFMGGRERYARSSSSRATFTFVGREVSWVATRGATRGRAQVWIDGTYRATVNLSAATTATRRVVYRMTWSAAGLHRIQIRVLGTAGHPLVEIDSFAILR